MLLQRAAAAEDLVWVRGLPAGGLDVLGRLGRVGLVGLQEGWGEGRRQGDVGVWEGDAVRQREKGGDGERDLREEWVRV